MTKRDKLIKLRKKALEADLPLKAGATKLVFGAGDAEAEILMIGEGPGRWEDEKGIPFVGNAGSLLNQMLVSINLDRDSVFITNMVMYRPPNNRDPEPEELDAFKPYIDGIVDIMKPKAIVTLGRFSMAKFIPGVMISNVHGKLLEVDWKGRKINIVPMYHPAAGLRNGMIKEKIKQDFQVLKEILERPENEGKQEEKKVEKKSEQIQLI